MSAGGLRGALPPPISRRAGRIVGSSRVLAACWRRGRTLSPARIPDCLLARNEYGAYCVPRSCRHRPAARAILQARVWERDTLALLRGVDPDGDVVHAGTFFGDFLPALASSRGDGARVWAFEPNEESYRCASITTLLNGLENVTLTHAALSAERGTALLATSDSAGHAVGGGSHLLGDGVEADDAGRREQVELLAVDEVIGNERAVALIQLDVEGHEQMALAGAMRTIERCLPVLVLESLPEQDWTAEHLAPLGYRVGESVDANKVLRSTQM
jgi:FkbM family methyltransferase